MHYVSVNMSALSAFRSNFLLSYYMSPINGYPFHFFLIKFGILLPPSFSVLRNILLHSSVKRVTHFRIILLTVTENIFIKIYSSAIPSIIFVKNVVRLRIVS